MSPWIIGLGIAALGGIVWLWNRHRLPPELRALRDREDPEAVNAALARANEDVDRARALVDEVLEDRRVWLAGDVEAAFEALYQRARQAEVERWAVDMAFRDADGKARANAAMRLAAAEHILLVAHGLQRSASADDRESADRFFLLAASKVAELVSTLGPEHRGVARLVRALGAGPPTLLSTLELEDVDVRRALARFEAAAARSAGQG